MQPGSQPGVDCISDTSSPAQRQNEVLHKVLCQAFFQESGKTLSSRDWDESVWFASWCHPISERPGRSLWTPCCGGGAAPVSRPAGGAVFGRVRLRGVLSTWGRSPWDLSLSGGVPDTHAPSWRWTLSAARAGAGRGNGENVSLRWRRGCGWGSSPRASPSLPGPDHGSAAQRWPRWWPWGRSAGHTAWRWTARCRPALRSGGR